MHIKILPYPQGILPHNIGSKTLVGGCFDLLHFGHLSFLKAAKTLAEILIVCLEPDATIQRMKKANPIHTQSQRAEILAELICVDYIFLLPPLSSYEDYLKLVKTIQPNFLAITKGDSQLVNKQRQAHEIGAKVVEVNQLIDGLSSSLIRHYHL